MLRIATACHKRVPGDDALSLFNLTRDISEKYTQGCGIYFCPQDAFGQDVVGSSLLGRLSRRLESDISTLAAECQDMDMLIILGYLGGDGAQKVAVINKGQLLFCTDELSSLNIVSSGLVIAIRDVNDIQSHSSPCDVLFLLGQYPLISSSYDDLDGHIKFLSRKTAKYVFYSITSSSACREDVVQYDRCFDHSRYDFAKNPEEIGIIDTIALDNSKTTRIPDTQPSLFLRHCNDDIQYPAFPLVEMEKDNLLDNYHRCAQNIASRAQVIGSKGFILGLSGGVDSASCLVLAVKAAEIMGLGPQSVMAYSMPSLGTSARTRKNSRALARALGCTFHELSLTSAVKSHLRSIGHDIENQNVVFENAQARERTQVLLDLANEHNVLQLGTGDLSEAVLGWCTFAGDACAAFNVNLSFSKTQLQYILSLVSSSLRANGNKAASRTIDDILNTPISPELLPPLEGGQIRQRTEDINGPYELVDFIIYLYFYKSYNREQCLEVLLRVYKDRWTELQIVNWCDNFEKRFLRSAFKRYCSSPSPIVTKIGEIVYNFDMNCALTV